MIKKFLACSFLFISTASADTFKLAWDPVVNDIAGTRLGGVVSYKVYVSNSPIAASWPTTLQPDMVTTETNVVLNKNTVGKYYFVVTAFNDAGESTPSNEVTAEIKQKAPLAPTNLKVVN